MSIAIMLFDRPRQVSDLAAYGGERRSEISLEPVKHRPTWPTREIGEYLMVASAPKDDLQRIIESARRLGVEMDQEEALQWLTAMAAEQSAKRLVIKNGAA